MSVDEVGRDPLVEILIYRRIIVPEFSSELCGAYHV
jgi:hypothetical protein